MADPSPLTRHDAHPFEARRDAARRCAVCGEHPRHILHHPTRVRAARALRGLPPLPRPPRPEEPRGPGAGAGRRSRS